MKTAIVLAYSYIRFSNLAQADGDSLRRQIELAEAYCRRRGWALSEATYRDLGVSAFKGKNALVGNLGEFLKAVESGAVKPGSALIVESLDRISRQGIDEGYDLIKRILKAGIILVTLLPERAFDVSATKSLSKGALEIQLILERAAEESERKSERVGSAWREKKHQHTKEGRPVTARTPGWIRFVPAPSGRVRDGKFELIRQAADTVRQIFRMAIEGRGITAITTKLNQDKASVIAPLTKRRRIFWGRSYVSKILSNRAAVGEYQPFTGQGKKRQPDGKPIADYFPAAITEDEWFQAHGAMALRKLKGGRPAKSRINIFTGLLRDATDGSSVIVVDKGSKGGPGLVSYRAFNGVAGSKYTSFPLPVFERAVLSCLREISPSDILPNQQNPDQTLALSGQLTQIETRIERLKTKLKTDDEIDSLVDVLRDLEQQRREVETELHQARQEAASPVGEAWHNCHGLIDALDKAPNPEDARLRLRAALRRICDEILVVFVAVPKSQRRLAAVQMVFKHGAVSRRYIIEHKAASANAKAITPAQTKTLSIKANNKHARWDLSDHEQACRLAETLASGQASVTVAVDHKNAEQLE
jgi:DNA invertase Pin-like site-specific DNA recombinase